MKSAFITFLFVALVASQSDFDSLSYDFSLPNLSLGGPTNMECLNDFYNGLYNYFGLNQTFVNTCFNENNADDMFIFYVLNYEAAQAFTAADRYEFPIIAAKLKALNQSLSQPMHCYLQSEDFHNLMAYFGMNYENQGEYHSLMDLYGQAHANDIAYTWTPFINLIQNAEYAAAGTAFAPNDEAMHMNASQANSEYEIYKAIQNGIFFYYNLSSPYELSKCYNSETGAVGAEFYSGWSEAVATTSSLYAVNATLTWRDNNEELIQQLTVLQGCFENTVDQAKLNNAVGYDVNSEQFEAAMEGWMTANPILYWGVMKEMYNQLNHENNPLGAGMTLAGYYAIVANSISENADISMIQD